MKKYGLKTMVLIAILAAISFILMYFKIPLIPSAPFLTYDLSEVIAMLGAFILGPVQGVLIVVVKALLYFILGPKDGGWVGAIASLVSGLSLVLGSVFLIRKNLNLRNKILAVIISTIVLTITMSLLNYFVFLPLYGIGASEFSTLIATAVVPFNIIKGVLSTTIAILVFMLIKKQIDKRIYK